MAGEQRKHLSSYLYDSVAVALPVAEVFTTAGVPLILPASFCLLPRRVNACDCVVTTYRRINMGIAGLTVEYVGIQNLFT